jgi:hypothetical protein
VTIDENNNLLINSNTLLLTDEQIKRIKIEIDSYLVNILVQRQ